MVYSGGVALLIVWAGVFTSVTTSYYKKQSFRAAEQNRKAIKQRIIRKAVNQRRIREAVNQEIMRMKYLVVASGVVLLLVSLCSLIECSCSREVPAGTDCSTAGGECGLLYDKNNAHAPPTQIPFSPAKYV